jgi:hypothetical protein
VEGLEDVCSRSGAVPCSRHRSESGPRTTLVHHGSCNYAEVVAPRCFCVAIVVSECIHSSTAEERLASMT